MSFPDMKIIRGNVNRVLSDNTGIRRSPNIGINRVCQYGVVVWFLEFSRIMGHNIRSKSVLKRPETPGTLANIVGYYHYLSIKEIRLY